MTKLKWCIKRTPENYKEVNEWIFKNRGFFTGHSEFYIHSEKVEGNAFISDRIYPDFHEINLDEFRLLTDPEKYNEYSLYENHGSPNCAVMYYRTYIRGHEQGCGLVPHYPIVSKEVFNELHRMWKEREGININAAWFDESNEVTPEMLSNLSKNRGTNSIKDRDMSGIMGLLPNPKFHVDDFKTEAEKEILKRLKKIDKKLTKLIKKQKHQF